MISSLTHSYFINIIIVHLCLDLKLTIRLEFYYSYFFAFPSLNNIDSRSKRIKDRIYRLKTRMASKKFLSLSDLEVISVMGGVLFLILTSQMSIPLKPVPITLQTFGVMLVGLTFKRSAAIKSIIFYLLLGAMGAPVFANFQGGYHCLMGPTGGYLWGFLAAIIFMTTFRKHLQNENLIYIFINCMLGTLIILACGFGWLGNFMGFEQAVKSGLFPFLIPGFIKIILVMISVRYLKLIQN